MRFNSVGFALSVGMALIVVLFGFTLLSAAGLAGFAAGDTSSGIEQPVSSKDSGAVTVKAITAKPVSAEEEVAIAAGESLFGRNCAQCHAVNEVVVGPALAGITKRRTIAWLIPWIKNSSKVVASGDEYAVVLYNKFNKQQMPSFALSDQEVESILAYTISREEPAVPTGGVVAVR
ncbi:cytochrome c [Hymenobacter sp.]|uniref:c-type cytochrome n=1 Tax=Hymenobacter sp. TaxID=1898978 RepID=UPI00286A12CC|nr:cytochrome c [Hymenobacter sp.]